MGRVSRICVVKEESPNKCIVKVTCLWKGSEDPQYLLTAFTNELTCLQHV